MFWDVIADENCTMAMDCTSNNTSTHHVDTMNMSVSSIVASDELSLYADELDAGSTGSSGLTPHSPPATMMHLLSADDDESPRRFQIVNRKKLQTTTTTAGEATAITVAINGQLRSFHSLSSCSMDSSSIDDEYMELIEMESMVPTTTHNHNEFPAGLNTLISGHIVEQRSPLRSSFLQRPSVRRCLSLTTENQLQQKQKTPPKTPELLRVIQNNEVTTPTNSTITFKRPDPPSNNNSPIQIKRLRGGVVQDKENLDNSFTKLENAQSPVLIQRQALPPLRKCVSMNDAEIMTALARSDNVNEPELIGDLSKPFVLPLMEGRHRDLKSISSDTVARLLKGEFADDVANFKIIDCRYPYEYEGGHIRGALNLYTQEQILEEFMMEKKTDDQQQEQEQAQQRAGTGQKRNIIIFHCEFSSERGPKLSRFLRNYDRARNTHSYPSLDYPEMYLLHNGYKDFYQTHKELCDPISYTPMLEPSFNDAYRHFRAKSKSWNGDGCGGGGTSRHLKKSRSRLML